MNDKIEREVTINAPISTVWETITRPEHISKWFSDSAELELKPGGIGKIKWERFGEAPLEIVDVDEPHIFSFRWVSADEETRQNNGQTLVKFVLTEDGEGTRLLLTETGFAQLDITNEEKKSVYDKHSNGWISLLTSLQNYASTVREQDK